MIPDGRVERHHTMEVASEAAKAFLGTHFHAGIQPLGEGNINDTYLVHGKKESIVLQKINKGVFPQPEEIVDNGFRISAHIEEKLAGNWEDWSCVHCLRTSTGQPFYRDNRGEVWRAQTYLQNTTTYPKITTLKRARQIGGTLGRFHWLVQDLPVASLHEPLPGFHDLPQYMEKFKQIQEEHTRESTIELSECLNHIQNFPLGIHVLEVARKTNVLTAQVIHGDPKADNFLFSRQDDRAIALIDLDTVSPGILHYDLGDCLRSCCNSLGEKDQNKEKVEFNLHLCRELLAGYIGVAADFLTDNDRKYIFEAVALITFELGLRFVTDYLAGDKYFKIHYEKENLHRALVQFHLLGSIFQQEKEIREAAEIKAASRNCS